MILISQRSQIASVAERWRQQYGVADRWPEFRDGVSTREIYNRLLAIDVETATPDGIADIIGNDSWIGVRCDECKNNVDPGLMLGDEPDVESHTIWICRTCLLKAVDFLETGANR